MQTNMHLWLYLAEFSLEWEMFQTKVVEKIKTHILGSITFPLPLLPESLSFYEIMCKNMVESDGPRVTI